MQNVLGRIAATLVILCPVIAFSIPESAIQASSIKSGQTEQVKYTIELFLKRFDYIATLSADKMVDLRPRRNTVLQLYTYWASVYQKLFN